MRSSIKTTPGVLMLAALVMFGVPFANARPRAANPSGAKNLAAVQQAPQRPPAKSAAPAQPRPQAGQAESDEQSSPGSDAEMQQQLLGAMRAQFEREALDRIRYGRQPNYNAFDRFMDAFIPFLVFVGVTLAILWILRTVLDNRRWNRMVKVQTETHAKLLDRFSTSQDMLAYVQSEAGRKFLEMPLFEDQRRQVSVLPFSRILWSVQVGIIVAFFGAGLLFLRGRVTPEADQGFQVFGVLILTLGIGFLVSGGVSYVLAKYFGLLEQRDALARSGHNA
jgi:hypothetical protein